MTLKLTNQSNDVCKSCDYDTYGFRQCAQCAKESADHTAKLISLVRRARERLQFFKDIYGLDVVLFSKPEIAELEQLLAEVEE